MRAAIAAYFAVAVVFAGLDFVWLSATAVPLYRRALGAVMAEKADMSAAVAFYLVYVAGVVIFAVNPALQNGEWRTALTRGALFGFFTYATYDLTNLATLKVWSLRISLIDMAWGTFVIAIAAGAGAAAALALKK